MAISNITKYQLYYLLGHLDASPAGAQEIIEEVQRSEKDRQTLVR